MVAKKASDSINSSPDRSLAVSEKSGTTNCVPPVRLILSNMAIKRSARRIVVALVATLSIAGAVYFALALAEVGKHKDKLWLHRCNSIEKLNEKYGDYTNVELDVCFRDSVFDVTTTSTHRLG